MAVIFDHPEHDAHFELPEDPTIRQRMEYDERYELVSGDTYPRLWNAVRAVAQEWSCEILSLDANIDDLETEAQLSVMKWAGLAAFSWRQRLREGKLPKNS